MTSARESHAPALQVRAACRRLGGRAVLHDVTFDLPRGTLTLLAGPNGAGKSSLLRAIGGRLALDAGDLRIDGQPASAARAAGRLGVVPQDIALDAHLSVRENLRLWATLAGAPPATLSARIEEGLAWTGLTDRAGARLEALSGGMRRRVNLLAGLLHRPALLLLDEPTVGVDRESRAKFYALLRDLRRDGVGVLLATHELGEAAVDCDAVVVMAHGRVVTVGAPAEVVRTFGAPHGEVLVGIAGGDAAAAVMTAEGFAPAGDDDWVRPEAAAGTDLRALDAHLTARGVDVRDVRWRRSALPQAVAAAIARQPEAAS